MAEDLTQVVPDTAMTGAAQTPAVEKEHTTTPEVITVPLADWASTQERLATLERQTRTAQSDKDKKKAVINKSFARKIQAVTELADSEGWDKREIGKRHKDIADEHAIQMLELENVVEEEPTPAVSPSSASTPTIGVATADEQQQAFAKYIARASKLAGVPLTIQDVDTSKLVNRRVNTRAEAEAFDEEFDAAITKAVKVKQGLVNKNSQELLDEQEAQRVADAVDAYGGIGGNIKSGAAGAAQRNSKSLDADLSGAYNRKYPPQKPR